uniref:MICOS complex subunit n=1 Tax=Parastrongyloides trichosuri TaxID=131310 RepID=A0A0N4ZWH4_PARTI
MEFIENIKNTGKDFYKQWVTLSTTENKAPINLTTIEDLPLYSDKKDVDLSKYTFVEEGPKMFQKPISVVRYALVDQYSLLEERVEIVRKFSRCVKKHYNNTKEYIEKEGTLIPKAAAITIGGLAGFILGVKRYGIRKFVYAGIGIGGMTAFCYPERTVDVVRTGYYHSLNAIEMFKEDKKDKK